MLRFILAFALIFSFVFGIGNGQSEILLRHKEDAKELSINGKKAQWIDHPVLKDYKFAIISAPYKSKSDINITNGDEKLSLKLQTLPYKKETLNVQPGKINPPKSVQKRIQAELKEANKVYSTFTQGLFINKEFIYPLNSKITSPFGTARVYNGMLKSYHGGTDFRAATGVKIPASNAGIVRIAKDRYYAGGSVVIDHGSGIYTQYYHLSKILGKVGDEVKRGQIIALSGASGRVSGPHLHFWGFANGAQVDPMHFISNFNQSIFTSQN